MADSDAPRPGERIHEPREAMPPSAGDADTDPSELAPDTQRPPPGGIEDPEHQAIVRTLELRIDKLAEDFLSELAKLRVAVQCVLDDGVDRHELRRSHEHLSLRVQALEVKAGNGESLPPG